MQNENNCVRCSFFSTIRLYMSVCVHAHTLLFKYYKCVKKLMFGKSRQVILFIQSHIMNFFALHGPYYTYLLLKGR